MSIMYILTLVAIIMVCYREFMHALQHLSFGHLMCTCACALSDLYGHCSISTI